MNKISINPSMAVAEVIALLPEAADLLVQYGMNCSSCSIGGQETLKQAVELHGFDDDITADLYSDLELLLEEAQQNMGALPKFTDEAVDFIRAIAKEHKEKGSIIELNVDEAGSFFLEFLPIMPNDRHVFYKNGQYQFVINDLCLLRLSNASISINDGRLKLDVPSGGNSGCGCANPGDTLGCGCH